MITKIVLNEITKNDNRKMTKGIHKDYMRNEDICNTDTANNIYSIYFHLYGINFVIISG
jgi:hypothetical protein